MTKKAANTVGKKRSKSTGQKFTKDTYLEWFKIMQLIREFETMSSMLYGRQKIRGFLHLYIGQEAIVAGSKSARKKDDKILTAYRDHGHALAFGMDPKNVMAELYGKVDGGSKGKGGSMHLFSKEHNFYGGHGIVGAGISLGTGIALAEKYRNTNNICLNYMGDGASLQGAFYESLNLAMTWKLPVVYIIENNKYGMGTSIERVTNVPELYEKACAFKMPAEQVDGMKVEKVHQAVAKAAKRAREEQTPTLLEMITYRYKGHSMSDPAKYRSKKELEEFKHIDPIDHVADVMKEKNYITEEKLKKLKKEIKTQVQEAIDFAEKSPFPEPSELFKEVYKQDDYPFLVD